MARKRPPDGGDPPAEPSNVVPFAKQPPKAGRNKPRAGAASPTNQRSLTVAERRRDALELMRAGLGPTEIAVQIAKKYGNPSYNRSSAHRDIREALDRIVEAPAREVLEEQLSTLAGLQQSVYAAARGGDLKAIDRILRIMHMRNMYWGLYSPIRQQLVGETAGPAMGFDLSDPTDLHAAGQAVIDELLKAKTQRRTARSKRATGTSDQ
jgi:hypothetical protein